MKLVDGVIHFWECMGTCDVVSHLEGITTYFPNFYYHYSWDDCMVITDPLDPSPTNFHFREFILENEDLSFASRTIS
jgi:hypothetical protein